MPALALRSCSAVRRTTVFAATLAPVLGALLLTAQAYSLGQLPGFFIPQQYFKHVAVYTRAIVLSAAGKLIWVEYGSDGKEGREIAEASGQYQTAKTITPLAMLYAWPDRIRKVYRWIRFWIRKSVVPK